MQIYCPNCETAHDDAATACTVCGHALASPSAAYRTTLEVATIAVERRDGISGQNTSRVPPVSCPYCRNTCSPAAPACPSCGHPLNAQSPDQVSSVPDMMDCPSCKKRIVPQWIYTGRKWALAISGIGTEAHGRTRMCPLCGCDIDELHRAAEAAAARQQEDSRQDKLAPTDRVSEWIEDKVKLVFVALIVIVLGMICLGVFGR